MKVIFTILFLVITTLTYSTCYAKLSDWNTHKNTYYLWQDKLWPDLAPKNLIACQIWQESLWNPKAELKTSREYGFGLVQITQAWDKNGKLRFDNFAEAKKKYKELRDWKWADRWNIEKQIIYIIKEDYFLYLKFKDYSTDLITQYALMLSAYNGGTTLLLREISLCKADPKCDSNYWFCNIAYKAARSTTKYQGYGKSFFDINREYPLRILLIHPSKIY